MINCYVQILNKEYLSSVFSVAVIYWYDTIRCDNMWCDTIQCDAQFISR